MYIVSNPEYDIHVQICLGLLDSNQIWLLKFHEAGQWFIAVTSDQLYSHNILNLFSNESEFDRVFQFNNHL